MSEYRQSLALSARALNENQFEILAITAGKANGWDFPASVLRASLDHWEGVSCFIDHGTGARSLRDMAGTLGDVRWDAQSNGIRARLTSIGPAAPILSEMGHSILDSARVPAVGFSADVLFEGQNGRVDKILHIYSVDLVNNPARGGVFLREINKENANMDEQQLSQTIEGDKPQTQRARLQEEATISLASSEGQEELQNLRAANSEMSSWMLESTLRAENLPQSLQNKIRQQFQGQSFAPTELQTALSEARSLLSELEGAKSVNGPARIEGMHSPADRLQAATDDLFGAPRESAQASLSVPRLSGIRELYLSLTGDLDFHGAYQPQRAQLANTADFSGLVKNSLNKLVANTWQELGRAGYDWWKDICVQEHFNSLHDITGTLIGTVGDLPSIAEGANYTEIKVGDSPETASFTKYGGYIPLTLELIDRDETRKLRAYARELASAGMRKISRLVAEVFSANSGTGPLMADGAALFNNTASNLIKGHANLGTLPLNSNNWDSACASVYRQPMLVKNATGFYGAGPQLAVNPKFILCPRALQKTAMEICAGSFVREQNYVYDNVLKGSAVPLVVPEWTDANDWAAVCDPRVAPAIFIGERFGLAPEIFIAGDELSPAVFSNDEHRLKVRHYLAVWVNDYRPLYKSNVA